MKTPDTHQQHGGLPLSTSALFADLVRRHNLAVNDLTETQLAEAIRQAMPDFRRYVHASEQSVVYLPGQEVNRLKERVRELEEQKRKLLSMMESCYNFCMGDCDQRDMEDWVDDYNALLLEILPANKCKSCGYYN
jgi:hypothetical protein